LTPAELRSAVLAGATALLGAALGVAVTLTVLSPPTPTVLERSPTPPTVPVTFQEFVDPRAVEVVVEVAPPHRLLAGRSGTLTSWSCAPGKSFDSGKPIVAVDGDSMLALATSVPLWRDVAVGAKGEDVAALQRELGRLGYPAHSDGVFSRADLEASTALARTAGIRIDGVVPLDRVVWIPASRVTIEGCEAGLGETIAAGQVLATIGGTVSVQPVVLPEGRLPGSRVLTVFSEPVTLGREGEVPADTSIAMIRSSPAVREAASGNPEAGRLTLAGQVALASPVRIAVVPASAVFLDAGGTACVFTRRTAHVVTVVGSEFGDSFVVFEEENAPQAIQSTAPTEGRQCQ
jgi:peptidoglycan hydrolase-like protein with peptidoglycan-binding domain